MARQSRKTKQKNDIREIIEKEDGFFTAQDIATKVQKKNPSLGIATIYRYLAAERKTGHLHSYSCGGKTIYSVKQRDHCHFTCEVCGKTTHVHIDNLTYLQSKVAGSICHVQVDMTGVCEKCQKFKFLKVPK